MPDSKVEMLPLPIMPPYLFRIQFRSRIQMRTNDRVRKGVDLHPPKRFIASHSVSVAFNMAEEHKYIVPIRFNKCTYDMLLNIYIYKHVTPIRHFFHQTSCIRLAMSISLNIVDAQDYLSLCLCASLLLVPPWSVFSCSF